ncbi:lupus La protein homolog B-like [Hydractinia symbiolongicarpus]|uniref:lupus La protein homolog B-like n=1 Tax=Hydractinia symbiolongicarpus TaxID=13093 RepID=UPI0025515C5B|nr:lupus La protein homolog B-like [Hydractinia symbiolongicarpus]
MASNESETIPEETKTTSTDQVKTTPENTEAKNAENDTSAEPLSDLDKKLIRQIEYYFGDVNLPRDKFLQEKIPEDDGWITLECLTTFNRVKKLSTDLAEIAKALKKSDSGLLEINDVDFKVRRSPDKPLPDHSDPMVRKASKLKTLYMKGFPDTYTLDNIQEFFDKLEVKSIFIKLRTNDERKFKGSIFIEFTTQEEAEKLLNDKELKCEDQLLVVMTRDDYFKKKNESRKNPEDEQKNAEEDRKTHRKPGCALYFKNVGEGTSREDLKTLFGEHEKIAWVDFNRGETEGFVRFHDEGAAQKAIDAVKAASDGKIMINGVESTLRVIEGEEEENYWKMVDEDMKKQRQNRGGRGRDRGRGRSRGRGEKNFRRKRQWEDGKKEESGEQANNEHKRFNDDETKATEKTLESDAKKAKVESEP